MEGSEHELPLRDPRSAMHEADYWSAVLEELREVSAIAPRIADPLVEVPIAMLELVLGGSVQVASERIGALIRQALAEVSAIGDRVDALGKLADGRLLSLRREAGLEE